MLLPRSPREFCWLRPAVPPPLPRRRRSRSTRQSPELQHHRCTESRFRQLRRLGRADDVRATSRCAAPTARRIRSSSARAAARMPSACSRRAPTSSSTTCSPIAAYTNIWGDGTPSTSFNAGTGSGMSSAQEKTHTVYGQLPNSTANQDAPVGAYADTITVTIDILSGDVSLRKLSASLGGRRRVDRGDGCHGRHVHDLAVAGRFRRQGDHGRADRAQRGCVGRGGAGPGNGLVTGGGRGCPRPVARPSDLAGGIHAAAGRLAACCAWRCVAAPTRPRELSYRVTAAGSPASSQSRFQRVAGCACGSACPFSSHRSLPRSPSSAGRPCAMPTASSRSRRPTTGAAHARVHRFGISAVGQRQPQPNNPPWLTYCPAPRGAGPSTTTTMSARTGRQWLRSRSRPVSVAGNDR